MQKSSEFQKRLFESAVGSIRIIAANHLWQVTPCTYDYYTLCTLFDQILNYYLPVKACGCAC